MRLINLLSIFAFVFSCYPASTLAQAAQADLTITGVEFSRDSGKPTFVEVKNIGSTAFTGEIITFVTFLSANNQPLTDLGNSGDYGRISYYNDFINGARPRPTIAPNQTFKIPMTNIPGHRHRQAINAQVSLRVSDSNLSNNSKTFAAPTPDLLPKFISMEKQAQSNSNNYDDYMINFEIANNGSVGFVGQSTLVEPSLEFVIHYASGKQVKIANNLIYLINQSIPSGGTIARSLPVYVQRDDTPQFVTITIDPAKRLSEYDKSNNSLRVPFTATASTNIVTSSPTPTVTPSPTPIIEITSTPIVVTELSSIQATEIASPAPNNTTTKLLGIPVKPCTVLASIKDGKDNLTTALTTNKSRKVENKLKQAAARASSVVDADDSLIDNPQCLAKQLNRYEDSQADAVAIIKKIDQKDHAQAEALTLLSVQSGITQVKTLNWQLANSTATTEVKKIVSETEKTVINQTVESTKIVTDEVKLKSVVKEAFRATDSSTDAVLNLDLIDQFSTIPALKTVIKEIEVDSLAEIKETMSEEGDNAVELKAILAEISDDEAEERSIVNDDDKAETKEAVSESSETNEQAEEVKSPEPIEPIKSAKPDKESASKSEPDPKESSTPGENVLPNTDNVGPNTEEAQE